MTLFIIEYDRPTERLLRIREFPDDEVEAATAELDKTEAAKPPQVEVVMLQARSRDDLPRTHGRYFKTARELAGL